MKPLFQAITLFVSDLATSLLFLILYLTTHNAALSACLAIALGLIQIALRLTRRQPVYAMAWLSLFLVIASGAATILTDDPRYVMFKASAIYAIIGMAMLKPGWMSRYLPEIAKAVAADVATRMGFAWAALMFASAALNAGLVVRADVATWALTMAIFGIASKAILFLCGFAAIRLVTQRRLRAMPAEAREALLISTGWRAPMPPSANPASAPKIVT